MSIPTGTGVIQHLSPQRAGRWTPAVLTSSLRPPAKSKRLDQVRQATRTRHCSCRTEDACVGWITQHIVFHGKRHPVEVGNQGGWGPARLGGEPVGPKQIRRVCLIVVIPTEP
jgi:hypothetical protein